MILKTILFSFIGLIICQDLYSGVLDDYYLVKKLDSGYIRGKKIVTENGVEGFAFLSVPVTEPPVGELRFKKPVPKKPWKGILETTDYTVSCYWNSTVTSAFTDDFKMDEDCVHLHIYTNKNCLKSKGCAVAFYIHGGNFAFGTPMNFNQSFLVDNFANSSRNVVFVTPSFRQAAFASLNLNWKLPLSSDVNVGLHDLVFELQWVRDNIHVFGGDSSRITVLGHSGGATIANYMAISPVIQKMFQQVAILSRRSDAEELFPDRNQAGSRMTAIYTGCTNLDMYDPQWEKLEVVESIIACLRNKSALEISAVQRIVEPQGFAFQSAALDYGEGALLPTIYEILDKSRNAMPMLTGTVSKELLESKDTVKGFNVVDQVALRRWCYQLIKLKGYSPSESAIQSCMVEYNTTSKSVSLFDDVYFYVSQLEIATSATTQGAPVYLYQFEYEDIGNAYYAGYGNPQPTREEIPGHAMELIYLVGQHLGNFTEKDYQIKYLYSQIFADFINYGTPNTFNRKWDKFDPTKLNYFVVDYPDPDLKNPGMTNNYHKRAFEFWHKEFPIVAGSREIFTNESEFLEVAFEQDVNATTPEPIVTTTEATSHGTNWQFLFWLFFALFILTVLAVAGVIFVAYHQKPGYETV